VKISWKSFSESVDIKEPVFIAAGWAGSWARQIKPRQIKIKKQKNDFFIVILLSITLN
jgi:hypothetical protein